VAGSSWDETVRLWEAESGQLLAMLRGHAGAVNAVALSGDGLMVASGGDDGTVRVWDAETGISFRPGIKVRVTSRKLLRRSEPGTFAKGALVRACRRGGSRA
jgi:WD40 repeat protein